MHSNCLRVTAWLAVAVMAPWTLRSSSQVTPLGGPVILVEADPHDSGTILAGTSAAVLFRSRDWAGSWTRLHFPAESRSTLHALIISPNRPNVYLGAVTSESTQYAGVFRSTDEGASWKQLAGLRDKQVWSLACWPPDGRVIAAGTQDGVYLTHDGGESWVQISSVASGPHPVVALAFDPAHPNILYAGTPHLSWKTIDSGASWRALPRGMQEDSDVFSIAVDWTHPRRLFAGACSGIYRSLDGGNSWASLDRAVGARVRTYIVAREPRSANIFLAGTSAGLLKSFDGGTTWRRVLSSSTRSIAFDFFNPHRLVVATDQGVLRSLDGGSHFVLANEGLQSTPSHLAAEPAGLGEPSVAATRAAQQ